MIKKTNRKKIYLFVFSIVIFIVIFYFIKNFENKKKYLFYKNSEKIVIGMTLNEIENIFGRPYRMKWIDSEEVDKNVIETKKALVAEFRYVFWKEGTCFYFDENKKFMYSDFIFLHDLH